MSAPKEYHELVSIVRQVCDRYDAFDVVTALSFLAREKATEIFGGDIEKADAYLVALFNHA
jgi:hypothetical protein